MKKKKGFGPFQLLWRGKSWSFNIFRLAWKNLLGGILSFCGVCVLCVLCVCCVLFLTWLCMFCNTMGRWKDGKRWNWKWKRRIQFNKEKQIQDCIPIFSPHNCDGKNESEILNLSSFLLSFLYLFISWTTAERKRVERRKGKRRGSVQEGMEWKNTIVIQLSWWKVRNQKSFQAVEMFNEQSTIQQWTRMKSQSLKKELRLKEGKGKAELIWRGRKQ